MSKRVFIVFFSQKNLIMRKVHRVCFQATACTKKITFIRILATPWDCDLPLCSFYYKFKLK